MEIQIGYSLSSEEAQPKSWCAMRSKLKMPVFVSLSFRIIFIPGSASRDKVHSCGL